MGQAIDLDIEAVVGAESNIHLPEGAGTEAFDGLVESIRQSGLIHRIVVRRDPEATQTGAEKYIVVDGHRRLAAARALGWPAIPAEVVEVSEREALAMMVAANSQRLENDPLLEAKAIGELLAAGMARREVAATLGVSEAKVLRRARLSMLTEPWRKFAATHNCAVGMLEKVAAYSPAIQNEVANEIELPETAETDEDGDAVDYRFSATSQIDWDEFRHIFEKRLMRLSDAGFDTAGCVRCESNTATNGWLFPGFSTCETARCENARCFVRKHNEAIDRKLAELRKAGTPAIEVAGRYAIPEYWSAGENRTAQTPQAYVFPTGELKCILWGAKPEKKERVAGTPEERAERKAKKAAEKLVKSARDKLRGALVKNDDGEFEIFAGEAGGNLFDRLAERRLNRELDGYRFPDTLIDDLMAEGANRVARGLLSDDEFRVYQDTIEAEDRARSQKNGLLGDSTDDEGGEGR